MFKKVWQKLFSKRVYKQHDLWYNNNVENKKEKGELQMENMAKVLASYKGKNFKVSNGKINQLERNAFKADFVNALALDLADAGLVVGNVEKGFAVLVDNDHLGSMSIVIDGVVKGLDYDFDFEVSEQSVREAEKAEKASKAKAKKEAVA